MRFCELLCGENVAWSASGSGDAEVTLLSRDSRNSGEGTLYFCVKGSRFDGHDFAADAYRRGCRHFVAQNPLALPGDATVLLCPDTGEMMARLAARYYREPAKGMKLIGVTGTKGKTTTAIMIQQLLEKRGIAAGYIGSLGVLFGDQRLELENTTPDAIELHRYLRIMADAGVRIVAIEVSSQGLSQGRVLGLPFEVAIFTNFTRDHIGANEHKGMKEYSQAKLLLFTLYCPRIAILNSNDRLSKRIKRVTTAESVLFYGRGRCSEYRLRRLRPLPNANGFAIEFSVLTPWGDGYVRLPFAGEHYAENFLAALAAVAAITKEQPLRYLSYASLLRVPGRCEVISSPGTATFVIDYAHNGASLRAALRGLRPYTKGRLFCLFGAIGDRARCRRRDMARAASRYADFSVITEDNPGKEDARAIVNEIYSEFKKRKKAICIPDRELAIRYLMKHTKEGDVVLLAGKGEEGFQLRGEGKIPFSEAKILREAAPPLRT